MPRTTEKGVFTVAAIRRRRGAKDTEVLFNESERVYTLPRTKARVVCTFCVTAATYDAPGSKAAMDGLPVSAADVRLKGMDHDVRVVTARP